MRRDYASRISEAMYEVEPDFESSRVQYLERLKERREKELKKNNKPDYGMAIMIILGCVGCFVSGALSMLAYLWRYFMS